VTKKLHRQDAEGAEEKKSFTAKDAKVAKGIIIKIKSKGPRSRRNCAKAAYRQHFRRYRCILVLVF
jgi:hypothetical protein